MHFVEIFLRLNLLFSEKSWKNLKMKNPEKILKVRYQYKVSFKYSITKLFSNKSNKVYKFILSVISS